jgi:hypothetical protein
MILSGRASRQSWIRCQHRSAHTRQERSKRWLQPMAGLTEVFRYGYHGDARKIRNSVLRTDIAYWRVEKKAQKTLPKG